MNKLLVALIAGTFASVAAAQTAAPAAAAATKAEVKQGEAGRSLGDDASRLDRQHDRRRPPPQQKKNVQATKTDREGAVRQEREAEGHRRDDPSRFDGEHDRRRRRQAEGERRRDQERPEGRQARHEGPGGAEVDAEGRDALSVPPFRNEAGAARFLPFSFATPASAARTAPLMSEVDLPRPAVTVATDRRARRRVPAGRGGDARRRCGSTSRPATSRPARRWPRPPCARRWRKPAGASRRRALVGIYRWEAPDTGATFVRFAFAADVVAHEPRPRARRRHRARAVAHLRRDRRAARDAPQPARAALRRRLSRRAPAGRSTSSRRSADGATAQRVVVGMSGGVDSSVAAWLLKQQGFDVVGVFMKNWEDDDTDEYCTSREDLVDAAAVADVIGIELEAVNFAAEYRERVFAHFLREYEAGRTPNPDVLCNSEIKFRAFLDHALRARRRSHRDRPLRARARATATRVELLKAVDATKDQSYFLHRLTQEQLAPVLFPLGEMREARRARDRAARGHPDVGEEGLDRHLLHRRAAVPRFPRALPAAHAGADRDARRRGRRPARRARVLHARASGRGWASAARATAATAPWFVAGKDCARNALIVVQGHDHPLLYRRAVDATDLHWIAGAPPARLRWRGSARRRATGCRTRRAASMLDDGGGCARDVRRRRNGRRRRASTSCSTTATCASAAASSSSPRPRRFGSRTSVSTCRRTEQRPPNGAAAGRAHVAPAWPRTECRRRNRRGSSWRAPAWRRRRAPPPPDATAAAAARRRPPPPPNSASPPPPPPPSRAPPSSCMRSPTISVEYFSTPSLSVYLRVCSRPSM